MTHHRLTFITPLFSKGSYDDRPEIRPASIRSQLDWWFRALGGSYAEEKAIFGGIHSGTAASKIVVRASSIQGKTAKLDTLPHKQDGQASPKWAFEPGTSFDLIISERLGGLEDSLRKSFRRTLETWLLLGTLGLRATRAGGSFTWIANSENGISPPKSFEDYVQRIDTLLAGAPLQAKLLLGDIEPGERARRIVSDTLGGRNDGQGENDLAKLRHPLGKVFHGRKTSPLRFRIVKIGDAHRIAAIWDGRAEVTGNQPNDLQAVIDLLDENKKTIGQLMKLSF